jgi:hypothetical protein
MQFLASNFCPYPFTEVWIPKPKFEIETSVTPPVAEKLGVSYEQGCTQQDYKLLTLQYLDENGGIADSIAMREWIKSDGHLFRLSRLQNAQNELRRQGEIIGGWKEGRWKWWRIGEQG